MLLPIAVRALGTFAGIHAAVARALLTTSREVELSARVVDLRTSQARIIAAADAERRRLERDLHDGAQQRLVALALNLRLARERLKRGDDARRPVDQAGDEAQRAIGELRDLARGIHPAVLTERASGRRSRRRRARAGAGDVSTAVRALPPPVEATAYFVVSEALANVAKYAEAERRRSWCASTTARLRVEISDDGVGGADPRRAAGCAGSPTGSRRSTARSRSTAPSVPDDRPRLAGASPSGARRSAASCSTSARRRSCGCAAGRGLVTHAAVFGVFQIAMIAIWALTGMGEFWPGWTILLWGVVLALHASLAILRQPITDSAVFRATADHLVVDRLDRAAS